MKSPRVLVALTLVNLGILILTLLPMRPAAAAEGGLPMLRGRGLEIVDDQGRVRASISVLPAGTSAKGDSYPETVLLRLITERGRPSVKLSTTELASGVTLAGPSGTSETYVILEAKGTATSLKLRDENGREQIVKPGSLESPAAVR